MSKKKYSVIMPTFNERENLPLMIFLLMEQAEKHKFEIEIIIVDDGSPDGTAEVCRKLMKIYPNKIILKERQGKLGLGSAYVEGSKLCTGSHVIILDADLSHQPKYIPQFMKKMEETGADIVTGTRYKNSNGGVTGWSAFRYLTSQTANFVATTMLGTEFSDLTGSFRLYTKEAFSAVIGKVESTGYAFQMEIVLRANKKGFKIEEVPIVFVERIYGESKFGAGEVQKYLKGVWNLMWLD